MSVDGLGSDARLDRLESIESIRQLAYRYALAVDSRDLDTLVELFVDDVRVGREASGRDALRAWFFDLLRGFGTTIHFVGNHIIDFVSNNEALGIVTCRDELEVGAEWLVGFIQYWDDYSRQEGTWLFRRRRLKRWYLSDAQARPAHGSGVDVRPGRMDLLPNAWPTWARFQQERERLPRRDATEQEF